MWLVIKEQPRVVKLERTVATVRYSSQIASGTGERRFLDKLYNVE
jgi:hypothetical protein